MGHAEGPSPGASDPPGRPEPDLGRPLLRLAIGLAVLGDERLASILSASSGATGAATGPTRAPSAARHVALGLLLRTLDRVRDTRAQLRGRLAGAGREARRLGSPVSGLLGRLPGGARAGAELDRWRSRGRAALARWAADGAREETEGRALARAALTTIRENTLARVTDSPDLKQVIRDQSQGIAVTAMSELRERSARADTLAEGAVRRLFGRRPNGR